MYVSRLKPDDDRIAELNDSNTKRYFLTGLNTFKNHNGLRPNKMHTFIAPTGVGKSTFVRTMVIDFLKYNPDKKVFIYLTEETIQQFETELAKSHFQDYDPDNLLVMSEMNLDESEAEEKIKEYMKQSLEVYEPDLFILDNITTSKMYASAHVSKQTELCYWLKQNFCKDTTPFIIAHTGSQVNAGSNKMLDENDLRGSKALSILSEFMYILQPFYVGNKLAQFILMKKHRGQPIHSKFLALAYDHEGSTFKDGFVTFDDLNLVYQKRNKLTDK